MSFDKINTRNFIHEIENGNFPIVVGLDVDHNPIYAFTVGFNFITKLGYEIILFFDSEDYDKILRLIEFFFYHGIDYNMLNRLNHFTFENEQIFVLSPKNSKTLESVSGLICDSDTDRNSHLICFSDRKINQSDIEILLSSKTSSVKLM